MAIFEGKPMPQQDEPLKLYDQKRSFLQRIFGK